MADHKGLQNGDSTKYFYFSGVMMLLCILGLGEGVRAEGNGGFAGSYLRIGLGAPAKAMGNAQVAVAADGFSNFYNPAVLPFLKNPVAGLSYSFMSLDRRFNYVGYARALPPRGGFAVGWIYSGVGNIRAYNSRGEDVGEILHGLHAVYFSFGMKLPTPFDRDRTGDGSGLQVLSFGISLKLLYERIGDGADFNYSGKGAGMDLGVLVHPWETLWFGYQIRDINSKLKSNTNNIFERGSTLDNRFPLIQKIGVAWQTPLSWLKVAYDFEWSTAGQEKHHWGLQAAGQGLAARAGWDDGRLTLGGGMQVRVYKSVRVLLDYAFVDDVVGEGVSHVFSWQFVFR